MMCLFLTSMFTSNVQAQYSDFSEINESSKESTSDKYMCFGVSSFALIPLNTITPSVKLLWQHQGQGVAYYRVEYKTQGSSQWLETSVINTSGINITDLYECTVWEFRVKTYCKKGNYGYSPIKSTMVGKKGNTLLDSDIALNVFPNPVTNSFTIEYNNSESTITEPMNLYNTQEQLVKTFAPSDINRKLDISDLGKGLYILNINDQIIKKINKM